MPRLPFLGSISAGRPTEAPAIARALVEIFVPDGHAVRIMLFEDNFYVPFGIPSGAVLFYDDDAAAVDGRTVVARVEGARTHGVYRVDGADLLSPNGDRFPVILSDIYGRALRVVTARNIPSPHSRLPGP